jgi:hypothetical protein
MHRSLEIVIVIIQKWEVCSIIKFRKKYYSEMELR